MRFLAIATDYDATLATNGCANPPALAALRGAQAAGRKLILITGRELESLRSVFPGSSLFDLIVAENGALLYSPSTGRERLLCQAVPNGLLRALRHRGVQPLSAGRCIIGTVNSQESVVRQAVEELQPHWGIIMNRESLMLLPDGIDKGTGLTAALEELGLSGEKVVGIGDAENDLAFLRMCGLSVAVGNAIPSLKRDVQLVTKAKAGSGVAEAVAHLFSIDP